MTRNDPEGRNRIARPEPLTAAYKDSSRGRRLSVSEGGLRRKSRPDCDLTRPVSSTKLTNKRTSVARATLVRLWFLSIDLRSEALQGTNLKKLLRTVEALADLGPELTADRDFSQTARIMLSAILEAAGAREAVLFSFSERPSLLTSLDAQGFALLPEPAIVPLLPRHVHTLTAASGPILLNSSTYDVFLSSNGNVAPELFKCVCPLKVRSRLVGAIALGRRPG